MLTAGTARTFSRLERLLLFLGIFFISVYVGSRLYGSIYSQVSVKSFWAQQALSQSSSNVQPPDGTPNFRLWSAKRIAAYEASLAAKVSPPLGVLEISSLQLKIPVLEGTDDLTLDRAVGHIAGTASLGELGNIGIAGHRDGFFRGLKDIHVGEAIDIYTQRGHSRYVVDEIEIVPPDNVSVLAPRTRPSLTLVTCYPFYFVGSAPSRYIVHAQAAGADDLRTAEPGDTSKAPTGTPTN